MRPAADPLPGGAGRPKLILISWRWSLPSPTDPVWPRSMHEFRVIVVTDPQTITQTGAITIHCAAA